MKDCGCRMAGHRATLSHMTAILYLKCEQGHQCLWRSAEEGDDQNIPLVTKKVYHAALCAGMGLTELTEFAEEVGFQTPGVKGFYASQNGADGRKVWIDAVIEVFEADLHANREMVKMRDGAGGTVVYQNARFDSSRDGYHRTVPVLDMVSGKPLHIVTLTRVETGSSWKTEDACVRKATEEIIEQGVKVVECVHDDKASVDTILSELGIHSSKDLWHKCKKFCAKFKEDLGKAKRGSIGSVEEARVSQDLDTLTAAALKKWLKDGGHDVKGKKRDLVDRVWSKLDKEAEQIDLDTRSMRYPEVLTKRLPDKLKTHFYHACFARAEAQDDDTVLLCKDIVNAADHWAVSTQFVQRLTPRGSVSWRSGARIMLTTR